ncbi:MAG: hypothetical protein OXK73_12915 [Rhodospirillaceae bacterium]|nr:hypothetical protein [Rhodospirillaceae bacterium]
MTEPADLRVLDCASGEAPAATDREAWIAAGRALAEGRSEASWEFADWLAAGHAAWGREALRKATEATGAPRGKIVNYLRAAKTYPPTRRRVGLTFSHHLEVAFLPEADGARILDAAEAGGWSHRETRSTAREASLEGKNARLRRENAELKRALKAAKADPRDTAAQTASRLGATRRLIKEEMGRAADLVEEVLKPETLDGLHGNARRGLARKIVATCTAIVGDVDRANERIGRAVAEIEDDSS